MFDVKMSKKLTRVVIIPNAHNKRIQYNYLYENI